MKNTKLQTPNPREYPIPNAQGNTPLGRNWWDDGVEADMILNENSNSDGGRHPFDLVERTAIFGEAVVRFCKKIPRDPANNRIINQLVGAATSVGANYCEADECVSKKDFRNTVGRCKKEAKETLFFFRMAVAAQPELAKEARPLYREAKELMLIFASIYRK